MSDLISRKALIDALHYWFADGFSEDKWWNSTHVLASIEGLPSAQPEQKNGKWIDCQDDGYVECPFCHAATTCDDNIDDLHYCYSCGAKMGGD